MRPRNLLGVDPGLFKSVLTEPTPRTAVKRRRARNIGDPTKRDDSAVKAGYAKWLRYERAYNITAISRIIDRAPHWVRGVLNGELWKDQPATLPPVSVWKPHP